MAAGVAPVASGAAAAANWASFLLVWNHTTSLPDNINVNTRAGPDLSNGSLTIQCWYTPKSISVKSVILAAFLILWLGITTMASPQMTSIIPMERLYHFEGILRPNRAVRGNTFAYFTYSVLWNYKIEISFKASFINIL